MKIRLFVLLGSILLFSALKLPAEDGYELWLRYLPETDPERREYISGILGQVVLDLSTSTGQVIDEEIQKATRGMLGEALPCRRDFAKRATLVIGTPGRFGIFNTDAVRGELDGVGPEGYFMGRVSYGKRDYLVIAANEPAGALYGTFHLLRILQSGSILTDRPITENPKIRHRLLNHWDNPDRTVERGYAGFSIWDWHKLPHYIDPGIKDYARANASLGINGTVITNVNANAVVLTSPYIEKVAALAEVFRPYGIKIYLTARFSSPAEIGGLSTSDPLDPAVREWWVAKADEIYASIPDFGGFLVKANSEGQPGPQDYGRTHADGANMLADALAPHGGIVMWRAFVYSHEIAEDRAKQAYNEFVPLDGRFRDNVFIQVKNGPIDFQPREPFHPLFGAMPGTALAPELQITQEYLGQGTHLVYLAPLFEECLDSDTYLPREGSTVARIIDGSVDNREQSAIAGVSNIGTDRNWTGHLFGQANWYAFGRLAWDHGLSSEEIAEEWIKLTFGKDPFLVGIIREIMLSSREAAVNYMTPLGLHHIMGEGHHYGPGPWVSGGRPDWTSVYYHRADSMGIGFDRTASGSNALRQYAPEVQEIFSDPETCPDAYLLWFHHLPWDFTMKSGGSLWEELCRKYDAGVRSVGRMRESWQKVEGKMDEERYQSVRSLLKIQEIEARWWRNACLLYFQSHSGLPFPPDIEQPEGTLREYMNLRFPYAPGIRPTW
ncbi:MAG: alpha-glucuronidase [Bacteroidales bacterium]|nr:alpha-glucuronidase [Bacteroidales bacterium]